MVQEKTHEALEKLLRLRQVALAQANGGDPSAILKFVNDVADVYRIERDNRRAELERQLADIRSKLDARAAARAK